RAQRLAGIADEADLDRVAAADAAAVDVYLHGARLAGPGIEFTPRIVAPDDQKRVASVHQVRAGGRSEVAHRAGHKRQRLVDVRLAEQARGDARTELLGHRHDLVLCPARALAHEQRNTLAGRQQLGCEAEI